MILSRSGCSSPRIFTMACSSEKQCDRFHGCALAGIADRASAVAAVATMASSGPRLGTKADSEPDARPPAKATVASPCFSALHFARARAARACLAIPWLAFACCSIAACCSGESSANASWTAFHVATLQGLCLLPIDLWVASLEIDLKLCFKTNL